MLRSNTRLRHVRVLLSTVAVASMLTGCAALSDRLQQLGEPPALSPVSNPTSKPGYKPVQMPMPSPQPVVYNPNSLWRSGSRAFFNDQRAHIVGDILTVKVNFNDTAIFQDQTQLPGPPPKTPKLPTSSAPTRSATPPRRSSRARLLTASGNSQMTGQGTINRQDQLVTNVAAVVTQVLPNGNMVIEGKQEVRLNSEMRELVVAGVVRPRTSE